MKTYSRQNGISLIEVLVVLVLLLVGILTVIRIFPPGFLVNKQAEATTLATRLAKQEVDRFTNGSVNLMSSIVPVVWAGSGFRVDLGATPDDLTDYVSNPPSLWDYYFSDVNKIRRILGEQVRIPLPSPTTAGRGSIYMLSSGPFMDVNWDGQNNRLFVSGSPMIRRLGDNQNDPRYYVRSAAQYVIDYDNAQIGFVPVGYDRQFLITYSYYDANWQVQTVVDQPLPDVGVVAAGFDGWIQIQLPAGAHEMVQGSDLVYRRFQEIATDAAGNPQQGWSADPYEFYVWSPKLAGPSGLGANVGVLVFNPNGRDYTEQGAYGAIPLTARIDYDVLDWRIIREDRPMPATPPFEVPLTLKGVKKLGDYNEDQTVYDGLFPGANIDMLVYNVGTGTLVPPVDPVTQRRNYYINYKDGIITFDDAFGQANASGTFRFFYKAHGDWALQVQKAADSYRRRYDAALGLNEFYAGGGSSGGSAGRIYFPLTEAGKTISIRTLRLRDASGAYGEVSNSSFQVNTNPAAFENVAGHVVTWIALPSGYVIDQSIPDPIVGVEGVSFRARVLWRNGATVSSGASGSLVNTRWRKIDVNTILTRSPF